MLMTVAPHDLVALCTECCTTLETLSAETGLLQEELLAFAAGRIPLNARDRLNILVVLSRHAPHVTRASRSDVVTGLSHNEIASLPSDVLVALISEDTGPLSEVSYRRLGKEIKEEESLSLGRSDH
jgi:hypothetical protein